MRSEYETVSVGREILGVFCFTNSNGITTDGISEAECFFAGIVGGQSWK